MLRKFFQMGALVIGLATGGCVATTSDGMGSFQDTQTSKSWQWDYLYIPVYVQNQTGFVVRT
jgi:hypothetical protein